LVDRLLVVLIYATVNLGFVHDLVETLGKDELLQMLLVDPLLAKLGFSDLVQVGLLSYKLGLIDLTIGPQLLVTAS
jgi:hypothetical protein